MSGLRFFCSAAVALFLGVGLWRHDLGLVAVTVFVLVPWAITEREARVRRLGTRTPAPPEGDAGKIRGG